MNFRYLNEDTLFCKPGPQPSNKRNIFVQIRFGHVVTENVLTVCPWEAQLVNKVPADPEPSQVVRLNQNWRNLVDPPLLPRPTALPTAIVDTAGFRKEPELNLPFCGKKQSLPRSHVTKQCELQVEPGQGLGNAHKDWVS